MAGRWSLLAAACLTGLIASPAWAASKRAAASDGFSKTFGSWTVTCDNVRRCVAQGVDADAPEPNLIVWLTREAGPDGAVRLEFAGAGPVDVGRMRIDGGAFATDPAKWRVRRDADDEVYPQRAGTGDAQVVAAWIGAARDAKTLALGDALHAPLAGLSAALLAIDDAQGRIGTVTAWRRAGAASAASVPPARALPVIRAAPPAPPLSDAEQHRLVAATLAAFRAQIKDCDGDIDADARKQARLGNSAAALSADEALVSIGCGMGGAYNDLSLWYRVRRAGPLSGRPVELEGAEGDDASQPPNALVGAGYAAERRRLFSFDRVRGVGDCGDQTEWVFDGARFVKAGEQVEGVCVGVGVDAWPWLYRTRRE
jgi:hypothetical protein